MLLFLETFVLDDAVKNEISQKTLESRSVYSFTLIQCIDGKSNHYPKHGPGNNPMKYSFLLKL